MRLLRRLAVRPPLVLRRRGRSLGEVRAILSGRLDRGRIQPNELPVHAAPGRAAVVPRGSRRGTRSGADDGRDVVPSETGSAHNDAQTTRTVRTPAVIQTRRQLVLTG